jgi:hypothetical protein
MAEAEAETESEAEAASVWSGNRLVLTVYVAIVALTGVFGFVIGTIRPKNLDPELFGFVQMPPTPTGLALYGMATVAVGMGVLLYGVTYVSERYDTAEARHPETAADEEDGE